MHCAVLYSIHTVVLNVQYIDCTYYILYCTVLYGT